MFKTSCFQPNLKAGQKKSGGRIWPKDIKKNIKIKKVMYRNYLWEVPEIGFSIKDGRIAIINMLKELELSISKELKESIMVMTQK